jgi:hypothetical protein
VQKKTRTGVAARKKLKRLAVREAVKKLKAAGKPIDLQAINHEVVYRLGRKKQTTQKRHTVLAI